MKIKAIYDAGEDVLDRYTIVVNKFFKVLRSGVRLYDCISASENGAGVFTWSSCQLGKHLGKKIKLEDLSIELQNMIKEAVK